MVGEIQMKFYLCSFGAFNEWNCLLLLVRKRKRQSIEEIGSEIKQTAFTLELQTVTVM